jgi:hypothetical protein
MGSSAHAQLDAELLRQRDRKLHAVRAHGEALEFLCAVSRLTHPLEVLDGFVAALRLRQAGNCVPGKLQCPFDARVYGLKLFCGSRLTRQSTAACVMMPDGSNATYLTTAASCTSRRRRAKTIDQITAPENDQPGVDGSCGSLTLRKGY